MREYLKFSLDMDSGEAGLSQFWHEWAAELMASDPLLAADLFKDVMHIAEGLYADALDALREDWSEKREKAGHPRDVASTSL